MKNQQKGFVVPLILILVVLGGGALFYKYNNDPKVSSPSVQSKEIIPSYDFSDTPPNSLVEVKLSHHDVSFQSPWGKEIDFKAGNAWVTGSGFEASDTLGQYTFANGVSMILTVNKLSPREELNSSDFSPEEKEDIGAMLDFIESKLPSSSTSYDYFKFILETDQKALDEAKTTEDKEGYSRVLMLKEGSLVPSSYQVSYQFSVENAKGFIYVSKNSIDRYAIDFWDKKSDRYTFDFHSGQDISKNEIDAVVKSFKSPK